MAGSVIVTCPQCKAKLKGPAEILGHKVRCKGCGTSFKAQAAGAASSSKLANGAATPKTAPHKATPQPTSVRAGHGGSGHGGSASPGLNPPHHSPDIKASADVSAYGLVMDESKILEQINQHQKEKETRENPNFVAVGGKGKKANPYGMTDISLAPRCPHCAAEMPSDKAIICINCGYNLQTRSHVVTKRTYDTTSQDVVKWRMPGYVCIVVAAISILWAIFLWVAMPSLAESEAYKNEWWTFMGGVWFRIYDSIFALFVGFYCGKFAYDRLIADPVPPEVEKK